jgi:hypothetical protein
MGLDMYLEADVTRRDRDPRAQAVFAAIDAHYPRHQVKMIDLCDYRGLTPAAEAVRDAIAEQFGVIDTDNKWIGARFNSSRVTLPLGYWRKANQLHRWFVEETQDGIDECQRTEVTREKLFELRRLLKSVLANRDTAAEALPAQEGFFFGGTDYDEYYFADLEHTLAVLDRICDKGLTEKATIHYQASW